jgi:hypothetical protein
MLWMWPRRQRESEIDQPVVSRLFGFGRALGVTTVGFVILCLAFLPLTAKAHAPSDTFLSLSLTETNLTGRWEITLRDLQHALGLDKIDTTAITPEELRLREQGLALDTLSGLGITVDGEPLVLQVTDDQLTTRPEGDSLVLIFEAVKRPGRAGRFVLNGQILFALDTQLHCIARFAYWGEPQQTVLDAAHSTLDISLAAPPSKFRQLFAFLRDGIWHIWTGYDHILFLIALLLPAVLTWREQRWAGAVAFRPVVINVLKIVTAFTVAHSLTLALAALHIVTLPSRLVESVIAASVVIAAANNLLPMFRERSWMVAFGFGLIHGFGFATRLDEAGLTKGALAMALIGFNTGVEIGQLAIVAVFIPIVYNVRHTAGYRNFMLRGGSVAVIVIAAIWMVERMFNSKLLPF